MKKTFLLLAISFGLFTYQSKAQGCSDAGFCTIDAFKPEGSHQEESFKNQFKVGLNFGKADNDITVFGQYLEYNHFFNDKVSLNTKLTGLSQRGNGISNFGLSDIYVNGNFNLSEKTILTAGLKIPLTDGNSKDNGVSLPMDYQSSLGTFDLILGLGYKLEKFNLAVAYQQPLSQNKNEFTAGAPNSGFFSTSDYERAGDLLIRVSYPIKTSDKLTITPSLLPIYHLGEDKATINNIEQKITGSDGLTLNANAYFDYILNDTSALQFSVGLPLVVRDARPDGLTRSFVANLQYSVNF